MTYRNDLDALAARHAALEAEVAATTRARDEVACMLAEARARERERDAEQPAGGPSRRRQYAFVVGMVALLMTVAIAGFIYMTTRPSVREQRYDEILDQMERFTDEICACPTRACSDAVGQRMSRWGAALPHDDTTTDPPRAIIDRARLISVRLTECMQTHARAEAELPDP